MQQVLSDLLAATVIPRVVRARQRFPRPKIDLCDIAGATADALDKSGIASRIKPGMSVAVTAGSRGIRNIDIIIR